MTGEPEKSKLSVSLDALLVLDAIDRCGSFAAAAEELCRVPSAISYTIQKLEQELNVVVFDRTGYRAKLTAAGSQLLKEGRELLRAAQLMERRVREIGTGRESQLAIGVSDLIPRFALYPLLRLFFEAAAHQSTQVRISREAQAKSCETLLSGRSDILIGALETENRLDGVRSRLIGEVELALAMHPSHPLARMAEPLSRRTIRPYRMVRQQDSSFDDVQEVAGSNSIVVDDYDSEVEAIRYGLGIGFVPYHLVRDDAESGRLIIRMLHDAPRVRLAVAWRAADAGKSVQWMLEHLRDEAIATRIIPRNIATSGIADLNDFDQGLPIS